MEVDRYLLTNDPEMKGSLLGLDTEKFNIRNLDNLLMATGDSLDRTKYSKESLYVIDAPKDDIDMILQSFGKIHEILFKNNLELLMM